VYLDSNSGSMIASAIVAGGAGLMVAGKVGMRKVTGVFKRDKGVTPEAGAPTTDTEQQ
jgi:hypothetical protein